MKLLTLALLFCLAACRGQQTVSTSSGIESTISRLADDYNFAGVTVAYWDGNKRNFFHKGYADTAARTAFDSSVYFEAGSITKTMTAYILLKVLNEHGIADTSAIGKFLPDSVRQNTSVSEISFLSLMNHTSGLPRIPSLDNEPDRTQPYAKWNRQRIYLYLSKVKTGLKGNFNYSNTGAALAGLLAENISGKSFEELFDMYINQPLKTSFTLTEYDGIKKATGYSFKARQEYWLFDAFKAAGAIKATSADLLNYLVDIAHNKGGLDSSIYDKMIIPGKSIGENISIGKGWFITEKNDRKIYWHNGGTGGFSTFAGFTSDGMAVVVAINEFFKNRECDEMGLWILDKLKRE